MVHTPTYHLFLSWYQVKDANRLAEYLHCLRQNLANPHIAHIHVLYEYTSGTEQYHQQQLPSFFEENKDKIQVTFTHRSKARSISYLDFIRYANQTLAAGQKFIIANTDIYFDETLSTIANVPTHNRVYALTRYNVEKSLNILGKVWQRNIYSQDSWFMETPFPESPSFRINLGWIGCDNRIAYELDKAGYQVLNISETVKSWHVHSETNQHDLYGLGYSYKYDGKPYLFLPFYSLEEVMVADFVYPRLSDVQRESLEFQLSSYHKELMRLVPKKGYVLGAKEYATDSKSDLTIFQKLFGNGIPVRRILSRVKAIFQ